MNEIDYLKIAKEFLGLTIYRSGSADITVGHLLAALAAFCLFFIISWIARRSIRRLLHKKGVQNEQTIRTTCSFTHYLLMIIGAVVGLKIAGIDLSAIFAAGAVITVGLGFAMQTIAQNFVSGIILFVERSIQADDILEVDGRVVKVLKIGVRSTLALTRMKEEMIIPNSSIVQGTVINYTMSDANYWLGTTVGVSYSSDMKKVREVLEATAKAMPWRLDGSAVTVIMKEFGDSSVNFGVFIEIDDPWRSRVLTGELNEAIWWALKEAGITIAFPQVDVHFDAPAPASP